MLPKKPENPSTGSLITARSKLRLGLQLLGAHTSR